MSDLTYTQATVAWTAAVNRFVAGKVDEVLIGGEGGDICVSFWIFDSHPSRPVPAVKVEVFEDSWGAFFAPEFQRIVARIRGQHGLGTPPVEPREFCGWLAAEGIGPSEYQLRGQAKVRA